MAVVVFPTPPFWFTIPIVVVAMIASPFSERLPFIPYLRRRVSVKKDRVNQR
jgi:hypothetical protein